MRRTSLLLALVAAAAVVADARAQVPGRIQVESYTLPNGLKVHLVEDHSSQVVAVDLRYDAGARNERPGRTGFAHLFEHMMFQGSANVKKAEHFQLVQRAGGEMNGSTTEDRTNYFEVVPSNRLNLALWLEADRMRSLAITDSNFHNQRETVKEERRLGVDNQPYSKAFSDGLTLPYDSTDCFAYAHTVIGDMADLNAAQVADVQAFFDTYYAPNNATLAVVGDFNAAELRQLVTSYFAGIPSHVAPAPVTCEYQFSPGTMRREFSDQHANLPAVVRLYRIPSHDDADTPALELMNIILGQGESSRLNVSIVRREKAALFAGSGIAGNRRGPGTTFAFGIANQGVSIDHVDSLLTAQLDTIRAGGITADEIAKAKSTFRARFIQTRETVLNKAEELHHYAMFHSSMADMNTDLDRYLAVTNDDLRRVATKYLDPANAVILIIRPAAAGGAQ